MDVISRTPSAEYFFRRLGVLTFSDEQGRLYPYSGAAATVLNALRQRAEALGVKEECGFTVSASCGFHETILTPDLNIDAVIREADEKMYQDKASRR